jgi:ADP-ribose pyrophosphatase YjhB (NUDIX family)
MADKAVVWMLVESDGAMLLVQRKRPPFRDVWVLPGDSVAEGETPSQTLSRVADEHLDVSLQAQELVDTLQVVDNGVPYSASVYRIGYEGRPRYREAGPYSEVGWAEPGELDELDIRLPEPLRELLARLGGGS